MLSVWLHSIAHIIQCVSDYSMKRLKYFKLAILNRLVVPADESHHILKIRDETGLLPVQVVILLSLRFSNCY